MHARLAFRRFFPDSAPPPPAILVVSRKSSYAFVAAQCLSLVERAFPPKGMVRATQAAAAADRAVERQRDHLDLAPAQLLDDAFVVGIGNHAACLEDQAVGCEQ